MLKALTIGSVALLIAALIAPTAASAQDGVPVPNLEVTEAVFAPSTGAEHTFVARGADRARMVAYEAVLITASLNSKVRLASSPSGEEERPAAVALLEGGFLLVVGSKGIEIGLGDSTLHAVSAEVMLTKLGEAWIVQVKPEQDQGHVELIPPTPSPAPSAPSEAETGEEAETATEEESAPAPAPAPAPVVLEPDKRHVVAGGEQRKAKRRESDFLLKTIDRLVPGDGLEPTRTARLTPRDIEDPRDFVVTAGGADAALGDLEIEDIEVDVGCVEICVD